MSGQPKKPDFLEKMKNRRDNPKNQEGRSEAIRKNSPTLNDPKRQKPKSALGQVLVSAPKPTQKPKGPTMGM